MSTLSFEMKQRFAENIDCTFFAAKVELFPDTSSFRRGWELILGDSNLETILFWYSMLPFVFFAMILSNAPYPRKKLCTVFALIGRLTCISDEQACFNRCQRIGEHEGSAPRTQRRGHSGTSAAYCAFDDGLPPRPVWPEVA
jgi:hypothetical protein